MKILFTIFTSLIFLSCNQSFRNRNNEESKYTINIYDNISKVEKLKFNIKSIIALETKKECLIGEIDKIIVQDSTISILDRKKSKSVLVFKSNGDFKKKIYNIGKGKGEYISIRDFIVDSNNKNYFLYDKRQGKILMFNNNYSFISERKVKHTINSLLSIQNERFIVERSSDGEFYVEIWDNEFNLIECLLKSR